MCESTDPTTEVTLNEDGTPQDFESWVKDTTDRLDKVKNEAHEKVDRTHIRNLEKLTMGMYERQVEYAKERKERNEKKKRKLAEIDEAKVDLQNKVMKMVTKTATPEDLISLKDNKIIQKWTHGFTRTIAMMSNDSDDEE